MIGWLIRGVHVDGTVFHLGIGGRVIRLDSLDSGKVFGNKESCRRKMCEIRKGNLLDDEDDRCEWSVVEVSC